MMRGPTSSVTISSASPLLMLQVVLPALVLDFFDRRRLSWRRRRPRRGGNTATPASSRGRAIRGGEKNAFTECVLGVWGNRRQEPWPCVAPLVRLALVFGAVRGMAVISV